LKYLIGFLLLLVQAGASAQSVDALRLKADMLDHAARAFVLANRCMELPVRELSDSALRSAGLFRTANEERKERVEIIQLTRDPRVIRDLPQTSTRACLMLEEDYGAKGRVVPNLIVSE